MITKKNLIVVLLTVCISAVLFVALPTRSQTSYEYDPWADVSGPTVGQPDGVINMRDINYEILRFNTAGTPIDRTELLSPYPKFFYSNGTVTTLSWGDEEGTTGWVTTKTTAILSNTVTNRTLIVRWNVRSLSYFPEHVDDYICRMRVTLNGTEKGYWEFNPPMLISLDKDWEFNFTSYYGTSIPNVDNSGDLILNLDFRIDCAYAASVGVYAEMKNNQFEVTG